VTVIFVFVTRTIALQSPPAARRQIPGRSGARRPERAGLYVRGLKGK